MMVRTVFTLWTALLACTMVHAAADSLRVINGQRVHEVERKETLFGIARAYDLDVNALLGANPSVRADDGLKPGQILLLPAPVILPDIPDVVDLDAPDPLASHVVVPGETLYGIARQYGTTVEALQAANPAVLGGLQPGDAVRIPGTENATPEPEPAPARAAVPDRHPVLAAGDTLRVLALLPFQFDADTLDGGQFPLKVQRLRSVALEMVQGLKWGAQELAAAGIPTVLDIRDAERDSLGRSTWTRATLDSADVVLGPLRRAQLDSALQVTAPTGKPHWILTPQPASLLAAHPQAMMYAPHELAALEALGESVARAHPAGNVLVLELAIEGQAEQRAFRKGFAQARAAQGLPADAGWISHGVSTRFAEGVVDQMLAHEPAAIAIPSGPTSRAMVANLQTELQLADSLPTRLYLHPKAADYTFIDRTTFERCQLTYPTEDWMDWGDSTAQARVKGYRDACGVEPGNYAWVAHEALLETARWSPEWRGRVPGALDARFDWEPTGAETGFINRAWRVQQFCAGRWQDAEAPCAQQAP